MYQIYIYIYHIYIYHIYIYHIYISHNKHYLNTLIPCGIPMFFRPNLAAPTRETQGRALGGAWPSAARSTGFTGSAGAAAGAQGTFKSTFKPLKKWWILWISYGFYVDFRTSHFTLLKLNIYVQDDFKD